MATTQIDAARQVKDVSVTNAKLAGSIATAKLVDGAEFVKRDGSVAFTAAVVGVDPTTAQQLATKNYVDGLLQGVAWKNPVRVATTANVTRSGTQTIDGVALSVNDAVLVKNQTAPAENGIYLVQSGAWVRRADADTWNELLNATVLVEQGTTQADMGFTATQDPGGTLDTTAVAFVAFASATSVTAGAGLLKTGNTIDVQAGDNSMTINTDDIVVKRDANGGIGIGASGITVKPDPTPASIVVGSAGVKVATTIRVVREVPSGTIDGANATFTLANAPSPAGSEEVFLNGILLEPGAGNDYTISAATITMLVVPISGDRLRASYMRL